MGGVIVAELGCAAVTPWRAVHITGVWRGYVGARDDGVLGGEDWLELVAVSREGWLSVFGCGLCVLFEDG